jgi:hypothetical protein
MLQLFVVVTFKSLTRGKQSVGGKQEGSPSTSSWVALEFSHALSSLLSDWEATSSLSATLVSQVPPLLAILGILIYGVMADVCFTGGWLAELVVRKISPREADRFAASSFSYGLAFSLLLTLSPAIIIGAVGIFGLLGHALGIIHSHRS